MCNKKSVSKTGKASIWVTVVFVVSYSGTFLQELSVTEGKTKLEYLINILPVLPWNYAKSHEAHRSGAYY